MTSPRRSERRTYPLPNPRSRRIGRAPAQGASLTPRDRARTDDFSGALRLLAEILSPLAAATALLFYFGWVRSERLAARFGFDVSVLQLSPQDYVLRSVNVVFFPIMLLLLVALAASRVHQLAMHRLQNERQIDGPMHLRLGRVARALRLAWFPLIMLGLLAIAVDQTVGFTSFPFVATVATLAALYGAWLKARLTGDSRRSPMLTKMLVGTLLAVMLFWDTERVAGLLGTGFADNIASDLTQLPSVTIYSPRDMQITALGVKRGRLNAPDTAYKFRYSGLRLLVRSGGRYFLLPEGWTPEDGALIVIPDDSSLRFEFAR